MDALDNVRVVDLSTGTAGPIVGMFLADFGADVVKVERPGGDPARALAGFAVWNRGKKSVVRDPERPEDREWLRRALAGADVCVVSHSDQLAEFDLSQAEVTAANPGLVLTRVPPYLDTAPWNGGQESHGLLAAYGGMARRQSSFDGGPVEIVYPFLLYIQGVWATTCTVAALVEREKSGFGQTVTVGGANALMLMTVGALTVDANGPDPSTAIGPGGRHPTYTRFEAGDGKWLASGALGAKFETQLLEVLGIKHILDDERMGGQVQNLVLPDNIDWARQQVEAAFKTRDRDEWLKILTDLGIPNGPLAGPEDWLDHPQVEAIGMRAEVDDPERGRVVMAGVPLTLTGSPGRVRGPAPRLGEHDATEPWPARPAPEGRPTLSAGPLAGVRVLNSGTFVASPYAGCLLAELGADVVKVEGLTGDPFRRTGYTFNRGMRSFAVDLKNPAGLDAFYQVVANSDVVIDGLRPGVTKTLKIDYDSLAAVKSDIITLSLSAYGEGGPLSSRPGVDMVLQAMSGMMAAQGDGDEPVANTIAIIDCTTAAMSTLGTVLALFHRARTGQGQRVWDALAATTTYLQSGEAVRYAGRPPMRLGGRDYLGPDPLDRFYGTADGWVRVQALSADGVDADALNRAGVEVSAEKYADDPAAALSAALAASTTTDAVTRLEAAGLAAVPARPVSAVLRDEQLRAAEFVHLRPADDGSTMTAPGRYATFGRTQRSGPMWVSGVGEHTPDVLAEAGLPAEAAERLVAEDAVVAGGPAEQKLAASYR